MTQPPVVPGPPQPDQPYTLGQMMPAPPRKRPVWPWVLGGVAAVLVLCVGGLAVIGAAMDAATPPTATPAAGATAVAAPATPEATVYEPPAVTYAEPDPAKFQLKVKVLKKRCFGSAGCNVTYQLDVGYLGTLDPSKTYRVTYEVHGVEDGPAVNNFTVTGDTASVDSEEFASTKSTKVKLTAKVTDVTEE